MLGAALDEKLFFDRR